MTVRIGMGPRAKGLTRQEFYEHWTTTHARLGSELPGLRNYVQNRLLDAPESLGPVPPIDYCSEVEFDSPAAMQRAFTSDHYQHQVEADERQLIDHTRVSRITGEPISRIDGKITNAAVKLMTFLRIHPAIDHDLFAATLCGDYANAVAGAKPLRHVLVLASSSEGLPHKQCCDAVDILWFESLRSAALYLGSETAASALAILEGRVFGSVRFLARPVVVFPIQEEE